jgi:hypothetical protein
MESSRSSDEVGVVAKIIAAALVTLLLAGCGGNTPSTASPSTAVSSPAPGSAVTSSLADDGPFVDPSQASALSPAGPIVGLVFADSIDPKGVPVNPRFTFSPDASQITVGVQVGALASDPGDLVVAWSQESDTPSAPLFSVHIAVHSGDLAFSTALSQSVLAEGSYLVTATIEGQNQSAQVDVAPGPTAEIGFLTASTGTGQPPIQGPTGVDNVPGLGSLIDLVPDPPGCVREWRDTLSQTSGTLDASDAPDVWAGFYERCKGSTSDSPTPIPVQVRATIGGAGRVFQTTIAGGGWITIDPCTLGANASDLPGTNVLVESRWQEGGAWHVGPAGTAVLTADTAAPKLHVTTTPAAGTKVKPGDTIEIDALSNEQNTQISGTAGFGGSFIGPWQTGVHDLQITADPGGEVGTPWTNPSNLPQSCGAKTWTHDLQATYTVPQNPPDVIQLCVQTHDYAGNERSLCRSFPTNDKVTITGTIETKSDETDDGANSHLHAYSDETATFTLVSTDGRTVSGTEVSHFITGHEVSDGCIESTSSGDLTWTSNLTGTLQKNPDGSLTLETEGTPPSGPAYQDGVCSAKTTVNVILLPVGGTIVNGQLDVHTDFPVSGVGYSWYEIHMKVVPNQGGG